LKNGPHIVFGLVGLLWLISAVALNTVVAPGTLVIESPDPSPQGYTWSLAFFWVPLVVIAGWMVVRHPGGVPRKAYWWTLMALIPLGFGLDIAFGLLFFTFENKLATLGFDVWGWDWSQQRFARELPIEEFGFYSLGFGAILSTYVWFNAFFLDRYAPTGHADHEGPILRFHWPSVITALVLTGLAIAYKKLGDHPYNEGFPGWMVFLIWVGFLPAAGFYRSTRDLINWRALAMTAVLMSLVSVIWEATLAVPYSWWGYVPEQMMGIFIGAWSGLPVEQPVLWVMISFTTAIIYEVVQLVLHKDRGVTAAMLGR
jgi:hypothetical protein